MRVRELATLNDRVRYSPVQWDGKPREQLQNLLSTPVSLEITFNTCPHDLRITTFASFDPLLLLDMQTGLLSVRF